MHAAGQTRERCRACSSLAQLVDSQTLVSRDSKGGASQARAAGSQTNSTVKSTICSVSLLASTTPRILGQTRGRVNEKHAASKYQDSCSSLVNGSRARAARLFQTNHFVPVRSSAAFYSRRAASVSNAGLGNSTGTGYPFRLNIFSGA